MIPDPMERMRLVREEFARQQAKMPRVDTQGQPIQPPAAEEPAPTGVPAPNPALGASASGAPDLGQELAEAQQRGDWRRVLELLRPTLPSDDAA